MFIYVYLLANKLIDYRPDALPDAQPTVLVQHWKDCGRKSE